ncbi:hypothetical protein GobsT_31310 [Gemmata obscuriglobus]|uniref:Uncharacterized protein n=1 Tax=Gemmata obscuriglobus TaxID=114 RepID=A0A2Z3HBT9_9BACT|nr:hypothetical protein [Gemmata obscuriglobus]AWM38680.1 hypothetical protein C1280_17935 [Gemmata obscuriglobus]QEG28354.1 hypothetical protein GobsT_31310 [Gemmata obscuriglobus]VTS06245.1 unnamed protein product [Gemmata obscuriglobus UQM 2246]VTS08147.1 unnamed protein product [Gemmata obscuriglobus UQM 2246]
MRRTLFVCRNGCRRQLLRDTGRIPEPPACPKCGRPMVRLKKRGHPRKLGLQAAIRKLLRSSAVPVSTSDIGWIVCPDRKSPRLTVYGLLRRMLARGRVRRVASSHQSGAFWTA